MSLLRQKVDDVIALLTASEQEAEGIEKQRTQLENSGVALSQREKRINDKELDQSQEAASLAQQKEYIDKQSEDVQILLAKIQLEKKELSELAEQKRQIEADRLQLEADKKNFEGLALQRQQFEAEKAAYEKEKELFIQEKKTHHEAQSLFAIREKNLKAKEDRIDTIERMTQV